jgi:L-cystine uptake protein TcyP (sodium:dicarboxylate symporter family)
MLNDREKMFIDYWEANRLKEKRILKQLLIGLPVGVLFGLPIIFILFSGKFWYKRADMVANTQLNPFILIAAVIMIIVFVSIFYKRHQWDMKEQQYLEIKAKQKGEQTNL